MNGSPILDDSPHTITLQKSGFEKLVDFIVSKLPEFAKLNEPILDKPIMIEKICTLKSIDQVKNWQGSQKW